MEFWLSLLVQWTFQHVSAGNHPFWIDQPKGLRLSFTVSLPQGSCHNSHLSSDSLIFQPRVCLAYAVTTVLCWFWDFSLIFFLETWKWQNINFLILLCVWNQKFQLWIFFSCMKQNNKRRVSLHCHTWSLVTWMPRPVCYCHLLQNTFIHSNQ